MLVHPKPTFNKKPKFLKTPEAQFAKSKSKSPNLTNSHNFYFIRRPWNLPGSLDRAMINPLNGLVESKRQKRVHGAARLALVPENIPAGGGSLIGHGRKSNSAGGFGAEKSGT